MVEIKLKPGMKFKYKGIDFICLDIINGNYLAITAKCWCIKRFNEKYEDGCNNWEKSTLRRFLNEDVLEEHFDTKHLVKQTSDLIADNGDKAYGTCEDYVTLLDCNQYRRCRKLMPKYGDWVWTLTPHSCNGDARHVHIIRQSGDLERNIAFNPVGVAPACLFNLNYLSSCWQAHIITHK
jgi:hypothetical protein